MNIGGEIAIGLGIAAGAAGIFALVQHERNRTVGIDSTAQDFISKYDQNSDGKLNTTFEGSKQHEVTDSRWISTGSNGQGYYSYDHYIQKTSIQSLVNRADSSPYGNGDGEVTGAEIANVLRAYDTGDGPQHPAGDNQLGAAERRNFERDFGERTTRI